MCIRDSRNGDRIVGPGRSLADPEFPRAGAERQAGIRRRVSRHLRAMDQRRRVEDLHAARAEHRKPFARGDVYKRQFQTIVLDPPAFAKSKTVVESALRAYREINLKALKLLETGGVLVTCSCSYHISEAALLETLAQAALEAGKTLRVLERRSQAQDHPVLLTVPETLYLK